VGKTGTLQLLTILSVSPGYLTRRTSIYQITGLREASRPGDKAHYLRVARIALPDALARCAAGEMFGARTVVGLCLAAARLWLAPGPAL
jgi:hypothetical protein